MDTEALNDLATNPSNQITYYFVAGLAALLILSWLAKRLFGKSKKSAGNRPASSIRLADLGAAGPSADGPQMTCFGAPVRLALVAIAPAGRAAQLPLNDQLPDVIDRAVPGLGKVFTTHKPVVQRWPGQLSAGGFASTFFRECGLPQDGAGTPWCNTAGPIVDGDQRYFIGMLLRADKANNLKQLTIEKETQWLEALKIS